MADDYQPAAYWADRLAEVGGLRSTGHVAYGEAYNRWLYRRKGMVLGRALRRVSTLDRSLDLGSGVGWVVEQLLQRGARHVHGVDIAAAAVEDLRRRFPTQTFDVVRLGEEPLPLDDGSIDCTTFLDVAYHIVDDALWEGTLAEAARVLVPGGGLVVIDAFAPEEIRPASHVRFRAADRWHAAAGTVGLEHVETLPCYRWLSRPRGVSQLRRLPESARGAVEYALDLAMPSPAHLSCVVYRRV